MKTFMKTLAVAGLFALTTGAAQAGVSITFDETHHYSDVPFDSSDRKQALDALADHFTSLGKYLPPGQDLHITVTDVDLAGRMVPNFSAGRDIRVVNGRADWPRMQLRYSLEQGGQVVKSGEAQLQDMNYQNRSSMRYFDSDLYRYEKQMIDDWFGKNIAPIERR
jgi:hypothetical protein